MQGFEKPRERSSWASRCTCASWRMIECVTTDRRALGYIRYCPACPPIELWLWKIALSPVSRKAKKTKQMNASNVLSLRKIYSIALTRTSACPRPQRMSGRQSPWSIGTKRLSEVTNLCQCTANNKMDKKNSAFKLTFTYKLPPCLSVLNNLHLHFEVFCAKIHDALLLTTRRC